MILGYLAREARRAPRYAALLILNVACGLLGLGLLEHFKMALQREVAARSRAEAGGDLVVSGRMPIPEDALANVDTAVRAQGAQVERALTRDLFTMAASPFGARLVTLRAQDPALPYYGRIEFEPGLKVKRLSGVPAVWVYPEVLSQFQVAPGDTLALGGKPFQVTAVVLQDAGGTGMRGSIAPRVYVDPADLDALGLIQKGSTVQYQWVFKVTPAVDLDRIADRAKKAVVDPSIRIETHAAIGESNARAIAYLGDYLGLVSLVAVALSMLGTVYLLRAHLADRVRDYAVLKMLGTSAARLRAMLFWQAGAFGALGAALALGLCALAFPLLEGRIRAWTQIPLELRLDPAGVGLVFAVGVGIALLCARPFAHRVAAVPARQLFAEAGFDAGETTATRWSAWFADWAPLAGFFAALAAWQAHSFQKAAFFLAWLAVLAGLLWGISWVLLWGWSRIAPTRSFETRHAVVRLARRPGESGLVFVVLAFGALLVALIATVETTLGHEFNPDAKESQASLFLFDIQDEQVADLRRAVEALGSRVDALSPLIRARLEKINGAPFRREEASAVQTREDETSERSRSRTYNLTERAALSSSETVTAGRYFTGRFDPAAGRPAEVSLDEGFARRVGLKVGDRMTFDVLGVPVEGTVVGLRRVRWASFQPNFFIQFQEGVFDGAPKTHLASISNVAPERLLEYQNRLVAKFPNVSVLDVRRVVDKLLEYTAIMATALRWMAWLVFASAAFVLLSVQAYHARRRAAQERVLRALGLVRWRIARIRGAEIWLWFLPAVLAGWAIDFAAAIPVTRYLFGSWPRFSWGSFSALGFVALLAAAHFVRTAREKA